MSRTLTEVIAELSDFVTADDVAVHLLEKDVKGFRQTASRCPIANYVRAETECESVSVGTDVVHTWTQVWDGERNNALLPMPVQAFIRNFDRYQYPELIAPLSDLGSN